MPVYKNTKLNTWYFRCRIIDTFGITKEITRRGFSTKREAIDAERRLFIVEDQIPTNELTFNQLFLSYQEYIKTRLKQSSIKATDNAIMLHVMPYFSNKKINEINSRDIIKWKNIIISKNYKHNYNEKIYMNFSTIFNFAVKHHGLSANPVKLVGTFKNLSNDINQVNFYTQEEFNAFINEIDDIDWNTFFSMLYYTGMRKGEVQALSWNDIDFDTSIIKITKTYYNKKDEDFVMTTPKTKGSVRNVLMNNKFKEQLLRYYDYCKKYDGFYDGLFVFGPIEPFSSTDIERANKLYSKKAKIKKIKIHDFRHSHASLLINNGANITIIAQRLGHSNVAMTLNTYSHMFPNKQKEIADLIDNLVGTK